MYIYIYTYIIYIYIYTHNCMYTLPTIPLSGIPLQDFGRQARRCNKTE